MNIDQIHKFIGTVMSYPESQKSWVQLENVFLCHLRQFSKHSAEPQTISFPGPDQIEDINSKPMNQMSFLGGYTWRDPWL